MAREKYKIHGNHTIGNIKCPYCGDCNNFVTMDYDSCYPETEWGGRICICPTCNKDFTAHFLIMCNDRSLIVSKK